MVARKIKKWTTEDPSVQSRITLTALCIAVFAVAGCSLPRGAALQSEILDQQEAETPSFQVVQVTRANLPALDKWPSNGWHGHYHWPKSGDGASSNFIRTGDRLDVMIWDSQENSLLTNPNERFTRLDGVEVEGNGSIFLPYVESVKVRGMTVARARSKVQEQFKSIVPDAQVQMTLREGRDHSVDVVSGVAKPGAYPLPNRNYKVLNALADAGGIPADLRNPRVRLLRGSKTYEISADQLFSSGSKNALLQPRDQIIVEQDDRAFTALGASGIEDLIYFPKDALSAMEAVALMNGINDNRADPQGILVLRSYSAKKVVVGPEGPNMAQVVFTLDLTTADGLFAAKGFDIQPDDTVLVTESPITQARTILSLFNTSLQAAVRANNL